MGNSLNTVFLQTSLVKTSSLPKIVGLMLLASSLSILTLGCRDQATEPNSANAVASAPTADADPTAADSAAASTPNVAPAQTPDQPAPEPSEYYTQGINRASSAYNFSQTARSPDDWRLVASRWQQAIELLQAVPEGDPNRAVAQQKIGEYQRNAQYAQQQAEQIIAASQAPVAVVSPSAGTQPVPQISPAATSNSGQSSSGVYQVPILRRLSNTPVVPVNFNGQRYEMILDTGASGTLITQSMANSLNITPVGRTRVATASSSSVTFSVGIVDVIQVGGIVETDVPVAIAGPQLDVGLLGHDVFGNFDITIRQNMVEFRRR